MLYGKEAMPENEQNERHGPEPDKEPAPLSRNQPEENKNKRETKPEQEVWLTDSQNNLWMK